MRIAVVGHVEHVTLGRVESVPKAGDIRHVTEPRVIAGGGGGVAFFQLAKSEDELHLFTAIGNDAAGELVEKRVHETGARIHAAKRAEPHTRVLAMIDAAGERTIVVVGQPLYPTVEDVLPWDVLDGCDAVYFTAQQPALLQRARRAKRLVIAARRRDCMNAAGVRADVVVGSRSDPREIATRTDFTEPPDALVLTEGARGGAIETSEGISRFTTSQVDRVRGAYGAGDSFAGALTWGIARGDAIEIAAARAARFGAAVLGDSNPISAQLRLTD